ncbi:hypothetical protein RCL1_000266 [Eukaryota sp. TZLM3-RCL]
MIDSLKSELEIVTLFKRKLTNLFTVVEDHYHKKESLKRRRRELDREVGRLSRLVSDYRQKKAELSLPNIEDPPSFCYALRYLPDLKEELVEVKLQFTNHQKLYESSIREVQTLTNEIRSKIVFNPDLIQFVEDYTRKKSLETQLNDEVNYRKFLQREIDSERRARLTLERDAKSLVKYFLKVMTEQASHLGLLDPNTDFDTEKTRLLSSYSVAVKIADIAVDAGFEQASSQLSSASGSTLMENKSVSGTMQTPTVPPRGEPAYPSTPHTPGIMGRIFPTSSPSLTSPSDFSDLLEASSPKRDAPLSPINTQIQPTNSCKENLVDIEKRPHTTETGGSRPVISTSPKDKKPYKRRPITAVPVKPVSLAAPVQSNPIITSTLPLNTTSNQSLPVFNRRHTISSGFKASNAEKQPEVVIKTATKQDAVPNARDLTRKLLARKPKIIEDAVKVEVEDEAKKPRAFDRNVGLATLNSKFSELQRMHKVDKNVPKNVKFFFIGF